MVLTAKTFGASRSNTPPNSQPPFGWCLKKPVNNGINYQPQPVICIPGLVAAARALAAGAPLSLPTHNAWNRWKRWNSFHWDGFLYQQTRSFFDDLWFWGWFLFRNFCVFIRYVEGKKTKILTCNFWCHICGLRRQRVVRKQVSSLIKPGKSQVTWQKMSHLQLISQVVFPK